MDAKVVSKWLDRLLAHSSQDSGRRNLLGARVAADRSVAATDGHRLLLLAPEAFPADVLGIPQDAFLPRQWLRAARDALVGVDSQVRVVLDFREAANPRIALWTMESGLQIDAHAGARDFPDVRLVTPRDEQAQVDVTVKRRVLAATLRALGPQEGATGATAILTFDRRSLWVSGRDDDHDRNGTPLEYAEVGGETRTVGGKLIEPEVVNRTHLQIGFNREYLLDALAAGDDLVRLRATDALGPIVIDGASWRVVVMPMRIK